MSKNEKKETNNAGRGLVDTINYAEEVNRIKTWLANNPTPNKVEFNKAIEDAYGDVTIQTAVVSDSKPECRGSVLEDLGVVDYDSYFSYQMK